MDAIRILAYWRSAPLSRGFSDRNMPRFHEHVEGMDLESGVVCACQDGAADAFGMKLAVGCPCGREPLAGRNLRVGTST